MVDLRKCSVGTEDVAFTSTRPVYCTAILQPINTVPPNHRGKKDKWVKEYQGQLLISTGAVQWTTDCSKALNAISGGNKTALKALKKKQVCRCFIAKTIKRTVFSETCTYLPSISKCATRDGQSVLSAVADSDERPRYSYPSAVNAFSWGETSPA